MCATRDTTRYSADHQQEDRLQDLLDHRQEQLNHQADTLPGGAPGNNDTAFKAVFNLSLAEYDEGAAALFASGDNPLDHPASDCQALTDAVAAVFDGVEHTTESDRRDNAADVAASIFGPIYPKAETIAATPDLNPDQILQTDESAAKYYAALSNLPLQGERITAAFLGTLSREEIQHAQAVIRSIRAKNESEGHVPHVTADHLLSLPQEAFTRELYYNHQDLESCQKNLSKIMEATADLLRSPNGSLAFKDLRQAWTTGCNETLESYTARIATTHWGAAYGAVDTLQRENPEKAQDAYAALHACAAEFTEALLAAVVNDNEAIFHDTLDRMERLAERYALQVAAGWGLIQATREQGYEQPTLKHPPSVQNLKFFRKEMAKSLEWLSEHPQTAHPVARTTAARFEEILAALEDEDRSGLTEQVNGSPELEQGPLEDLEDFYRYHEFEDGGREGPGSKQRQGPGSGRLTPELREELRLLQKSAGGSRPKEGVDLNGHLIPAARAAEFMLQAKKEAE